MDKGYFMESEMAIQFGGDQGSSIDQFSHFDSDLSSLISAALTGNDGIVFPELMGKLGGANSSVVHLDNPAAVAPPSADPGSAKFSISRSFPPENKNFAETQMKLRPGNGKSSKIQGCGTTNSNGDSYSSVSKMSNSRKRKSGEVEEAKGKNTQKEKAIEAPKDYIHVRARRGQATDSHSLAERVRREKISERMKLLQDLVPGCNKVTGKALMLDEIINYVQSLQRQVEFLSMKLASVNPRLDFDTQNLVSRGPLIRRAVEPQSSDFVADGFTRTLPELSEDDLLSIVRMGFAQDPKFTPIPNREVER